MASNNVEVEIKIKLTKQKFLDIRKKLKKIAKFIKSSSHIDDYYTPLDKSFLDHKYPYEWLMVTKRDEKILLKYKHWYPEGVKNTTHCDEYETEIKDKEQVAKILIALKFNKFLTINKKRETFAYKKDLEVVLDEVKGLGYFIEVESLRDFGGIKKTRDEILMFTSFLGLKKTTTVPGGYAGALMRKNGLVK